VVFFCQELAALVVAGGHFDHFAPQITASGKCYIKCIL